MTWAALLLALVPAAPLPAHAIIHGKPVDPSDPYAHAVVGVVPIDQYGRPGACTGTLLTPRAVLTAAHCVTGDDVKSVSIVFDLKFGDAHKVAVTRIVVHPDYADVDHKFHDGDVAVVFLAAHDNPTTIIPLDRNVSFGEGEQFVSLGYGLSITNRSKSSGVLRKAAIATTGQQSPREVELRPLGDAWPCAGDSGGPILRKDMSGHYAISGVMSAVYHGPVGECLFEAAFMTPVHTYADWIAATLAKGE